MFIPFASISKSNLAQAQMPIADVYVCSARQAAWLHSVLCAGTAYIALPVNIDLYARPCFNIALGRRGLKSKWLPNAFRLLLILVG